MEGRAREEELTGARQQPLLRSLFWRILATLWLAIALVAGLSILLGNALQQDVWILGHHPGIRDTAKRWTRLYEQYGPALAQDALDDLQRRYRVDTQVLDERGLPIVPGNLPPRAAALEERAHGRLPWRRLTQEYSAPSGNNYLFIYRIPHGELFAWQRESLFWPFSAIGIALVVLTGFSLLLTLSITRPLDRLRGAVHDLGQTTYQQHSLARLAKRRDELGLLARDFNRMGARLQTLIDSQRQLLRDVSHELRSPLARLRVALALAERASPAERQALWPRLAQECDRLEALIAEILALARLDADPGAIRPVDLNHMLQQISGNARLTAPEQRIEIHVEDDMVLHGWPDMLERAFENLLSNALRFNPPDQPVEVRAFTRPDRIQLSIRDHGPGVAASELAKLGTPFFRATGQKLPGHGLGLAIARRAIERHGGTLTLGNHPQGGFIAELELPHTPDDLKQA